MIGVAACRRTSAAFVVLESLSAALGVDAAALLAERQISQPEGGRGQLLGRINEHLARTTDADLARIERMLAGFVG